MFYLRHNYLDAIKVIIYMKNVMHKRIRGREHRRRFIKKLANAPQR
ncbi:hypothetical protein HMPREF0758_2533 [Serratia odorifera DSM 4582]|uniref:Uncharacterized protein n=1 Tax=Serratia odorifera DSM 4582 TaxID=667129 RepID=D4E2Y3_SEROD|nr:hypothetical protein HMPREF0758_2533 [Serratia odorifera DSM 4582]